MCSHLFTKPSYGLITGTHHRTGSSLNQSIPRPMNCWWLTVSVRKSHCRVRQITWKITRPVTNSFEAYFSSYCNLIQIVILITNQKLIALKAISFWSVGLPDQQKICQIISQGINNSCLIVHAQFFLNLENEGQIPPVVETKTIYGIVGIIRLLAGTATTPSD